mmetsp:Transcript_26087/g.71772  ORF Transcript_26087/g.71772 Transcript_26087/m.71772 type:complete len:205 (-) Transcript_26087:578-1192(-)
MCSGAMPCCICRSCGPLCCRCRSCAMPCCIWRSCSEFCCRCRSCGALCCICRSWIWRCRSCGMPCIWSSCGMPCIWRSCGAPCICWRSCTMPCGIGRSVSAKPCCGRGCRGCGGGGCCCGCCCAPRSNTIRWSCMCWPLSCGKRGPPAPAVMKGWNCGCWASCRPSGERVFMTGGMFDGPPGPLVKGACCTAPNGGCMPPPMPP